MISRRGFLGGVAAFLAVMANPLGVLDGSLSGVPSAPAFNADDYASLSLYGVPLIVKADCPYGYLYAINMSAVKAVGA
jgi:hypothetical protein